MKPISQELKSRLLTFGYNVGYVVLTAIVDGMLANLEVLDLPQTYVVVIGLALSQVSKYVHNRAVGE